MRFERFDSASGSERLAKGPAYFKSFEIVHYGMSNDPSFCRPATIGEHSI